MLIDHLIRGELEFLAADGDMRIGLGIARFGHRGHQRRLAGDARVEQIELGAHEFARGKVRQHFAHFALGPGHHVLQRRIHIDDGVLIVGQHHIGMHHVERRADAKIDDLLRDRTAEHFGGPGDGADLVAALGVGHVHHAILRKLHQDRGHALDRPADRQDAETGGADQNDDDEGAERGADIRRRRPLARGLAGKLGGIGIRNRIGLGDLLVDFGSDLIGARQRCAEVAVGLFQLRDFGGDGGIVLGKADQLADLIAIADLRADLLRRFQRVHRLVDAALHRGMRVVGLVIGHRQPDFADPDLHPLQRRAGTQQVGQRRLLLALQTRDPHDAGIAVALRRHHRRHERDADPDGDGEFGAD